MEIVFYTNSINNTKIRDMGDLTSGVLSYLKQEKQVTTLRSWVVAYGRWIPHKLFSTRYQLLRSTKILSAGHIVSEEIFL